MPQYLSTDPNAGQEAPAYLSTDPNAGAGPGLLRRGWETLKAPISPELVEHIANRYPEGPGRENIRSLVGGAISPLGLGLEAAGGLATGARVLRGLKPVKAAEALPAGWVGKKPKIVSEMAQMPRGITLPSQVKQAVTLEKAAQTAPKAAPTFEATFRPTTSKGPRATVRGAQGLTTNDIAAVEEAIAGRTGVSPRITAIRPHPEAVQTIESGRQARQAAYKSEAELNKGFKERLASEKGGLSTEMLKSLGRGFNQLRVTSMLSGLALPKSVLGNIGAIGHAAAETKSLRPITEAMRLPTNLKLAARAFKTPANPAHIQGMGRINLPGRAMSALDETTQALLQRAGLPLEKAQELLLTSPNVVRGKLGEALSSPLGRYAIPFQRTPFNQFSEGLLRMSGQRGAIPLGLAAGAGGAGVAAGSVTEDPRLLGLGAALAGPSGLPFSIGAAMTAGARAGLRGALPFNELALQDIIDPLRPLNRPAFIPAFLEE